MPSLVGANQQQVYTLYGEPTNRMRSGPKEILMYPHGRVVLEIGIVVEIALPAPPQLLAPRMPRPHRRPLFAGARRRSAIAARVRAFNPPAAGSTASYASRCDCLYFPEIGLGIAATDAVVRAAHRSTRDHRSSFVHKMKTFGAIISRPSPFFDGRCQSQPSRYLGFDRGREQLERQVGRGMAHTGGLRV